MAIKITENENGTVTEKTSRQIKRESKSKLHKFQKAIGVTAVTAAMIAMSSITAFAAGGNDAPANVNTATMGTLVDIVMWIVRIAILAIGGIPGLVKIVQGQQEENPRDRNNGIVSVVIAGVTFAATFAIAALIK